MLKGSSQKDGPRKLRELDLVEEVSGWGQGDGSGALRGRDCGKNATQIVATN